MDDAKTANMSKNKTAVIMYALYCAYKKEATKVDSNDSLEICPLCGRERGNGIHQCNFTLTPTIPHPFG